MSMKCTKLDV